MNLSFEKWHGAKNNFIVCHLSNNDDYLFETIKKNTQKLCANDGSGIGADGILILKYKYSKDLYPLELMILNSDGSLAMTCGNGIRCAVSSLRKRLLDLQGSRPDLIELSVSDRNYICRFNGDDSVTINMGPCLSGDEIENFAEKNSFVKMKLDQFNLNYKSFGLFNISNEHVVIELDELKRKVLFEFAKDLQIAPCWDGINVHFIKEKTELNLRNYANSSVDSGYDVLVWERGVGPTGACGSGACSVGQYVHLDGF